jgi:hypothetical protein
MYAPKNAYQKLLTMFFGGPPSSVISENVATNNGWDDATANAASAALASNAIVNSADAITKEN